MSDSEAPETKKCPYCGRMTSAKANFCWWCARELAARPERPDPTPQPKPVSRWVWAVLGALLLILLLALLFWR